MPTRTARTAWNGTLQEGSGQVELSSSRLGTYEVSWPKRTSEEADGSTSPEELIAAAHSSCFAMALSNEVAKAGGTPHGLEITADVTLGQVDGAPTITTVKLTVRGEVEGLDADGFQRAAEAAKAGCPVSRALTGVEISLDAALD
jgi:osmotically inducible protein OsmC